MNFRDCVAALTVIAALALCACGSADGSDPPLIRRDRAFAEMPNPGTLSQAIALFGQPDELGSDGQPVDCYAAWHRRGIRALFQHFGGEGNSRTCTPPSVFMLSFVTLSGNWVTDRGLRTGDLVARVRDLYPEAVTPPDCVNDAPEAHSTWRLKRVVDELGGPGAHICTLAVLIVHGKVHGFTLSSTAASE